MSDPQILTRRNLAAIAIGAAVAVKSTAQTPAAPDWLQQARDSKRAAAETLAKFEIPMSTEPSFQFKA